MHRLRISRWSHWIGVFLVLLPLLAPTISHALRQAAGRAPLPVLAGAACLPGQAGAASAIEAARKGGVEVAGNVDDTTAADGGHTGLHACGYCASPAFGHVVPTPDAAPACALAWSERIDTAVGAPSPQTRSARPRARSPPTRG